MRVSFEYYEMYFQYDDYWRAKTYLALVLQDFTSLGIWIPISQRSVGMWLTEKCRAVNKSSGLFNTLHGKRGSLHHTKCVTFLTETCPCLRINLKCSNCSAHGATSLFRATIFFRDVHKEYYDPDLSRLQVF